MAASGATGSLARAPSVFHRGVTDAPNAAPFWQDLLHWQASGPLTPGHALLAFSQADAFTRWLEHPQAPPALCQALQAKAWGLLPGLHRLRVRLTAQGPLLHLSLALGTEAIAACDFPAQTQAPAAFTPAGRVAVVGAGLAGAACARNLAERGWQVTVFERGDTVASGASGLPAGLVAPHASPDDAPVSRLSRAGVRCMRDALQALLREGEDWGDSGTREFRLPGKTRKGGVPAHWAQDPQSAAWTMPDAHTTPPSQWHAHAAWVKPARLVAALLDHPGIERALHAPVAALVPARLPTERPSDPPEARPHTGPWQLRAAARSQPAFERAYDRVVLACAHDSLSLLQALWNTHAWPAAHWPLQALRGQLSWGRVADVADRQAWPAHPIHGHGSFLPAVPSAEGALWMAGATYDRRVAQALCQDSDQAENHERLRALAPAIAASFPTGFSAPPVRAWAGVRCASPDRLPLVGPASAATPSLWLCTAMGSRGLTLALLCGEWLAHRWHGEPWAFEPALGRALDSQRFSRRADADPASALI